MLISISDGMPILKYSIKQYSANLRINLSLKFQKQTSLDSNLQGYAWLFVLSPAFFFLIPIEIFSTIGTEKEQKTAWM